MLENLVSIQYCYQYVINQIPISILMYAHIPTSLAALLFSTYILIKKRNVASTSLFLVSLCFSAWSFLDLNAWFPFMGAENMMFSWSLIDIFGLLFFFFTYRFLYAFIKEKDLPPWQWAVSLVLIFPTFVTTFLGLNLSYYNLVECGAQENDTVLFYTFSVQAIFTLASIYIGVSSLLSKSKSKKNTEIVLATLGVVLFLGFFVGISYFVTLLINYTNVVNPYNYEIYGLFGMPILLIFLGYLIVKFKSFEIKLAGAQALVFGLIALIASQLAFVETKTNTILVSVTLFFSILGGFFLVRSVKKEIKQREEIELLAFSLEKANVRLKELDKQKSEFVSIASHQLRSPLTAMRGYASMLAEGSFGKIPDKALEAAKRIEDSAKLMAMSVEDYLNVSRIESGNMKYNLSDFNVKEMTEKICDDLRPEALKSNLILLFRTDLKSRAIVTADIGKTNQIIHNLINNSIKYTPKGTINVFMRDDIKKKRIYVDITDTGIGMSQETIHTLFQKFSRADNANSVNVSGTGLGLYVAFKMAEAMGGTITCKSEGDGKGSTFTIELPLAM
jgi:signal transduction histidine kinase